MVHILWASLVAQLVNKSTYNEGGLDSISGLGRSPGEGYSSPRQYSCLENSMNRGAWRAMVHGMAKSQTKLGNTFFHFYTFFVVRAINTQHLTLPPQFTKC